MSIQDTYLEREFGSYAYSHCDHCDQWKPAVDRVYYGGKEVNGEIYWNVCSSCDMLLREEQQMSIKDSIKKQRSGGASNLLLENSFNRMFYNNSGQEEERFGLHASAIITGEEKFCYREQVLSLLFKRNKNEKSFPVSLLRIFKQGVVIHEKWQQMFVDNGVAEAIEGRGYCEKFDLYLTPDAIISLRNKLYIVEIKSCSNRSYQSISDVHPAGNKQLQLYMHFHCIPDGIVLCEDKDNQNINPIPVQYDYKQVVPYLERLHNIKRMKERYLQEGKLPAKKCTNIQCTRAQECPMREACFGTNREKLRTKLT